MKISNILFYFFIFGSYLAKLKAYTRLCTQELCTPGSAWWMLRFDPGCPRARQAPYVLEDPSLAPEACTLNSGVKPKTIVVSKPPFHAQNAKARLFFFESLCLYFILVHPLLSTSWLFWLFLFLFFLADLVSLVSLTLLSVDVCFACVYFSIVNFPWVPFSFAFLQASFVLPGALALCTRCQHRLLILDLAGEKGVEGVGGQLLRAPEKGFGEAIHILQTSISVPGQKSDTFSPQVLRAFVSVLISVFFFLPCFPTRFQWSSTCPSPTSCCLAFSETCFTYY